MESVLEKYYRREHAFLAPEACFSDCSKGRAKPVDPDPMRTDFQRDRDRIIHCKPFRRLMHKTQVFLSPEDDHYRTRLTHTLEVAQIARTIARALFLNEDLTEAIALGHDLGHTPFGHAGERQLNRMVKGGFRHYEQSLRVVDVLEGLNLTHEVRDGIVSHTSGVAETLEGQIVRYADVIAFLNHDIDDAIRAGVMSDDDIPLMLRNVLGYTTSERITTMVNSIVARGTASGVISMEDDIREAMNELKSLLFALVYTNPAAKGEEVRAEAMLGQLFEHYTAHPSDLPEVYARNIENDGVERCVADYISGMTDRYAIATFRNLFIPKIWQGLDRS
ncbi:MAG: deoxyguanosinetriphosphate triphosphohydrolase [Clostridia bacterium]|nr:deoxyguanosinetriphosphate triphosphohydrolase [Clostridia bacterium]